MPCFRALSPSELAHTLSVECESESRSVVSDSLWPHGLVHGILQARILEWVAFPFSRGSSQPRDWTQVSHIAVGFFTSWATREAQINPLLVLCCLVAQLYLTLCNPEDCSMPGFPVLHCLLEFAQTHLLSQCYHPIISSIFGFFLWRDIENLKFTRNNGGLCDFQTYWQT